jgi:hypothetical protein
MGVANLHERGHHDSRARKSACVAAEQRRHHAWHVTKQHGWALLLVSHWMLGCNAENPPNTSTVSASGSSVKVEASATLSASSSSSSSPGAGLAQGPCNVAKECLSGICVFREPGCQARGACWPPGLAWPPGGAAPRCGCDGQTFWEDLAQRPFKHDNPCPGASASPAAPASPTARAQAREAAESRP